MTKDSCNLVFIGGGGFAKEVVQYAEDIIAATESLWTVKGILAPEAPKGACLAKHRFLGHEDHYNFGPNDTAVIAIGDGLVRKKIVERLATKGVRFATLRHPSAYISPSSRIGPGTIVGPFCFVGPEAVLGAHVALNTYSSVGHDAIAGDFVTLSPYACLNGGVKLGEAVFLGSQVTVSPQVTVGGKSKIAAGSVVTQDAPAGSLLIGNPAKGRVMFR